MIQDLFFQLIQVSLGTRICLSYTPSTDEWGELYNMAKKQSLIGVCFAGVQRLGYTSYDDNHSALPHGLSKNDSHLSPSGSLETIWNLPEDLYLIWMGMAAKIQQRNEVVNRQCVDLQKRLAAYEFESSILKGQGVGLLYDDYLHGLRQSGDIDILVWKEGLSFKENKRAIIEWVRTMGSDEQGSKHHISVPIYEDTEVELHYTATYLCNPFANIRMQEWLEKNKETKTTKNGLNVHDIRFNVVYMLSHMLRHFMTEGVGLRQLMDYYFVLKSLFISPTSTGSAQRFKGEDLKKALDSFNMLKFASAVMWVIKIVFVGYDNHSDDDNFYLGIEQDEKLGRKLLAHIMQGGNFGHHNKGTLASKSSHIGRFINQLYHDLSIANDYPGEAFWAPLAMIRNFVRLHK